MSFHPVWASPARTPWRYARPATHSTAGREEKECDGQAQFPQRDADRNADEHDHRRGQREPAQPVKGHHVGIFHRLNAEDVGEQQRHDKGEHHALPLLLGLDGGPDGGVRGCHRGGTPRRNKNGADGHQGPIDVQQDAGGLVLGHDREQIRKGPRLLPSATGSGQHAACRRRIGTPKSPRWTGRSTPRSASGPRPPCRSPCPAGAPRAERRQSAPRRPDWISPPPRCA